MLQRETGRKGKSAEALARAVEAPSIKRDPAPPSAGHQRLSRTQQGFVRSLRVPLPGKCRLPVLPGRLGDHGVCRIILVHLGIMFSYSVFQSYLQQLNFGFQVNLFVFMQVFPCSGQDLSVLFMIMF